MEQVTTKLISPYVAVGLLRKNEYGIGYKVFKKGEISVFQNLSSTYFISAMEKVSGYSMQQICHSKRKQEFVQIRHILRYFLNKRLGISLKRCVELVPTGRNGNNHTTTIHSIRVVEKFYVDKSPTADPYVLFGRNLYKKFQRKVQFETL